MQRRDKPGGKAVKLQRRNTLTRRNAPKTARRRKPSAVDANEKIEILERRLNEALEQQTATSEVLKVISSSPGDLEPVFQAMLENATRICEANFGVMFRYDGKAFDPAARFGVTPEYAAFLQQRGSFRPRVGTGLDRLLQTKDIVSIADDATGPTSIGGPARLGGARSRIVVPMLKDDELIGAITIYRQEVRPFTDKQIELVKNFAAQAVIAIENARLLNELRQRTRDLTESLEQQTATSEVLKVISSSPGELEPVFQTMLENATRICGAKFGTLYLYDGDSFHATAFHNAPPAFIEDRKRGPLHPGPNTSLGLAAKTRQASQIVDITKWDSYLQRDPFAVAGADLGGYRTVVSVPMLKEDKLIGVISVYRQEVRSFTDKQIEVVKNFAAQAVIAIENTRLLNELRESLQQQTATADVLKVISRSTFDLQAVLNTLTKSAARLCRAERSAIRLAKDGLYHHAASHGFLPEHEKRMQREPVKPGRGSIVGRVVIEGKSVHLLDSQADPDPEVANRSRSGNVRTMLGVPLQREGTPIGVLLLQRSIVQPFTDKEIALAETFADQAVIAIENVRLFDDVQKRTRELSEALEQQTATSEVLKVISTSPGELEPVFQTMLENATRICGAKFGVLHRYENSAFRPAAWVGVPQPLAEFYRQLGSFQPPAGSPLDRLLQAGGAIYTADETAESNSSPAKLGGARSLVAVPMRKDNELVGAIVIYRQEVLPFSNKQVALLTNFAAQAVIAIENTRLLKELRQRTDDLSESLDQQTATSDVLKVISSSPTDTQPVFEAIVRSGLKLFPDAAISVVLPDSDQVMVAAFAEPDPARAEAWRSRFPFPLTREYMHSLAILDRRLVDIPDVENVPAELDAGARNFLASGYRALTIMPLIRGDVAIGALSVVRLASGPLSDKQLALLKTFADQAVIAIENTRLLSELRESLQQQTATADVLKVISRSTFDLQTVLNTLTESAARLCEADNAVINLRDGDVYRNASNYGFPREFEEFLKQNPMPTERGTLTGRTALEARMVHIPDVLADSEYTLTEGIKLGHFRTMLGIPLLRESTPIGVIGLVRTTVKPFTDKQIELVTTFADQAVIAIENVRLFDEVQARTKELTKSLRQQTATADVLKVISRSTFDLQTVLDTLVESAARLCEADSAAIHRPEGNAYPYVASFGLSHEYDDYMRDRPIVPGRGTVLGRAVTEGRPVQVRDVTGDPEYTLTEGQKLGGFRTVLGVPLMREGTPIGVIMLTRNTVRPFADKQIELASTFADQAAIAIENVRLFKSVEARTRELAASLEELRTAQDRLVQTEKLASLGQLTAGIAHEIKNPLNFVNNFSAISVELIDELREALAGANLDSKLRAQISEIADMLQGNLDKVVQHGKRADSIVKNMLLHSRQGSGEHRAVDINAVVEESLNLAYHGARAEKQGFNITLERSLDPAAGEVDLFPQEITRVLLNLISNGFYAATKRKAEANGGNYEPTLAAVTKNLGDSVEIRIRDNGTGIPPEVKAKMFNPFFTTKPVGEGTGLGLSLSYDIIVKQHGGSIEVETQPGEFTEFRIVLPRGAATIAKSGGRA